MEKSVMYLILRSDLISEMKWPLGAVFSQIAHATSACIWEFKDDPELLEYMADIDHMHKVTLKVNDESNLKSVAEKLEKAGIQHRVWVEDNMPVCIAVKPQPRSRVKSLLGHLPLYK